MNRREQAPVRLGDSRLNAASREAAIQSLRTHPVDVLVVGGGITGAGVALDAATRGLSTGIIEARDWASGTSSRSSKLVHGGIRYLEQLNFSLVREALQERSLLLERVAPHLVRPISFLYPVERPLIDRAYVGAGMFLYDVFARGVGRWSGLPFHRHFSKRQLVRFVPGLRRDAFQGGIGYFDAQVDDARLVMSVVRTASQFGARAASRVSANGVLSEGDRVVGVRAKDLETGQEFEIRANEVVNASGVWTNETGAMLGSSDTLRVRASKGIHIVVPRDRFNSSMGLLLRTERSVLFVIPWGRHWLIGTTDTEWNLDKAHPAATATDIDYLLQQVNRVLEIPLTLDDVTGVYAGLRPLLSHEDEDTSKLSREHVVERDRPGLITVTGGKLTTYRVMAADTVDEVVRDRADSSLVSVTDNVPLVGAAGLRAVKNSRQRMSEVTGVPLARLDHLVRRYGSLVFDVLNLIEHDPSLAAPLPGAEEYLLAEIAYAVTSEGALHLDDVLCRRTHVSIETQDRGITAAPHAARIMAGALGWDTAREELEVTRYLDRVDAELASQRELTDEAADRVRNSRP